MTKKDYKLSKSKTVRLSDSAIKSITYIANESKLSESELLRSIIEKSIAEYKLKKAFDAVKNTNASISEGANIAGLSYRKFYEKVIEHKILKDLNLNDKDNFDYKKHIDDVIKHIKKSNTK